MKPPVEAPTSRQRAPSTSTSSGSSALASLMPPRETNGGSETRQLGVSATSWLGLSASGPSAPIRTRPARTDSAALVRDGASPRSASRASIRCRLMRRR